MDNMMQDVTRFGTAARAARLGRTDLAGKTGTTNEFVDAWFAGYQPSLVAIAWLGFDQPRTLGRNQTGGVVALPMWVDYMGKALKDSPEMPRTIPPGVVSVPVLSMHGEGKVSQEFFYREAVPPPDVLQPPPPPQVGPPDTGPPPA
jgi:penicillin-binding protein 1A